MSAHGCPGILVVEDDSSIRDVLTHLLEAEGHHVTGLINGRDAVEYLEKHESPCFVLLDLMMPVMTGWELLKIREKSPRLLGIPVVIMSASLNPKPEGPNTAAIKKPFELETLVRIIGQFCRPHPSSQNAARLGSAND